MHSGPGRGCDSPGHSGPGKGWRFWWPMTGYPGWVRAAMGLPAWGACWWWHPFGGGFPPPWGGVPTPKEEAEFLKAQAEELRKILAEIEKRLQELEKEEE